MKDKKGNLKMKIAASLFAAAVLGLGGSAMAKDYTESDFDGSDCNYVFNEDTLNVTATNNNFGIDCWEHDLTINSKQIHVDRTLNDDDHYSGADTWIGGYTLNLGNQDTEEINISVKNEKETVTDGNVTVGIRALDKGTANVTAKKLTVNVSGPKGNTQGLLVQNSTQYETAPENAARMTIQADTISVKSTDVGIAAYSNGQMTINGDLTVDAPTALNVRGYSTTNINADGGHSTVLNGDIAFETPWTKDDAHLSGNIINANVNIVFAGEESGFNGRSYQLCDGKEPDELGNLNLTFRDGAAWNMTGDSFTNTAELSGGSIRMTEEADVFRAGTVSMTDGGKIALEGEDQKVNIGTLTGDALFETASTDNKVTVTKSEADSVVVKDMATDADEIAAGRVDAQDIADVVTDTKGTSVATKVTADEGVIAGAFEADVVDGKVVDAKQSVNQSNAAIAQMAAVDLMTWRQENNDMNKRLGELRASKGETGVWARMTRGEAKYGAAGVKNQYNYFQVGFDKKLGGSPWTVGFAVTRTEGETSFLGGKGENDHTGAAIYGSYLKDDGSFIDIIARYARLDHEYTAAGGIGSGDYDTDGYSLSAEYGKRLALSHRLWIEPQVELTYAKVSSVEYTSSRGAKVRHEGMDSLVGRLGFSLGRDIEHGNVYVRASYLYDFQGETDIIMSRNGATARFVEDLGGSWWEVGFGTNLDLSKTAHLYLDFEKTYGGNVETPWQWNVGCRWSF